MGVVQGKLSVREVRGELPTQDWIGSPTPEDVELFLWFLLENVASRPVAGKHQPHPISGNFVSYSVGNKRMRSSDRSSRIYASVRLLEIVEKTNDWSCRRVEAYLDKSLGTTDRGRPRRSGRPADIFDKVGVVRSIYNKYKKRHRWPEKLPERDLELELWWSAFLSFKTWANSAYANALSESDTNGISTEEWCENVSQNLKFGELKAKVVLKFGEIQSGRPLRRAM